MNANCLRLLAVGLLLAWLAHNSSAQPATRYNIISIVTDDQSAWSVGAYGNREAITPNQDRLAR